jgi:hypothetical protein
MHPLRVKKLSESLSILNSPRAVDSSSEHDWGASFSERGCILFRKRMHTFLKEDAYFSKRGCILSYPFELKSGIRSNAPAKRCLDIRKIVSLEKNKIKWNDHGNEEKGNEEEFCP